MLGALSTSALRALRLRRRAYPTLLDTRSNRGTGRSQRDDGRTSSIRGITGFHKACSVSVRGRDGGGQDGRLSERGRNYPREARRGSAPP